MYKKALHITHACIIYSKNLLVFSLIYIILIEQLFGNDLISACNCFGHSNDCYYDEEVDRNRSSIDGQGKYEGGGVCTNCRDNTEGINCNKCKDGFFRPIGRPLNATNVCQRKFLFLSFPSSFIINVHNNT